MLKYDPSIRISAREALENKWVQGMTKLQTYPMNLIMENLESFKIQSSFQKLVMTYIANYMGSCSEQARLRCEFNKLDVNGDGLLQKEELIEAYMKIGNPKRIAEEIVVKIMNEIDINNNGSIDLSEFLTANLNLKQGLAEKDLQEAFKLFDKVNFSNCRMEMDKLPWQNWVK